MSTVVASSAPLFSPLYYWANVPPTDVQAQLRIAFARWGLPGCLRVDNGKPWGTWSELPTALALWLIGLGIDMEWNDPCCPQQNGCVERSQGTSKRWTEPHTCRDVPELQARLDADDILQRERYPLAKGKSRWELFPGLAHTGKVYEEAKEAKMWKLKRVLEHLAGYVVPRLVDCQGKVSIYNHNYYVGTMHAGKQVSVQFDPDERHWVFSDKEGRQLRTKPALGIDKESICNLQMMGKK